MFDEQWGPSHVPLASPSDVEMQQVLDRLPQILVPSIEKYGWSSFGDGLFRFHPLHEHAFLMDAWFGAGNPWSVLIRTALGDLISFSRDQICIVNSHFLQFYIYNGISVDSFFNRMMTASRYIERSMNSKFISKCQTKLGPVGPNEIYAPVPTLALGGSMRLGSMRRVDAIPYFNMISQLHPLKNISVQ